MREIHLTRREVLSIIVAGTLITLFESCGDESTKPTNNHSLPSTSTNRIPQFLPGSITPIGLGVNIHFTEPRQGHVELINKAGFGFVRMDFPWSDIERQRGNYNFSIQDELVRSLTEQNIFALAVLDYSNPLYENIPPPFHIGPHTDGVRQAFANFAKAAAKKFKGLGVIWEIWNEPNNPDFWQPKPDAIAYMKLAKDAIEAIRSVDNNAIISAPAITTFPRNLDFWNFLKNCFANGLLEQIDAISIHPYRYDKRPETVVDDYQRLRTLISSYLPKNKKGIHIFSSEWGYPIITKVSEVSEDLQAAFLVRQFLINCMNEISLSIWYDWHDDGLDTKDIQNTFGILDWNYQPKPTYLGVQTLMQQLNGFRFNERQSLPSKNDFDLLFKRGNSKKKVVWTVDSPHKVRLLVETPSVTIVSMKGEKNSYTTSNGAIELQLTEIPQYLVIEN